MERATADRLTESGPDGFRIGTLAAITIARCWCVSRGGGYTEHYFNVAGVSYLEQAAGTKFDAVAVDRTGYALTDRISPGTNSFSRKADLSDPVTNEPWQGVAERRSYLGFGLVGHSRRSAAAVHLASRRDYAWPLLAHRIGLSCSSVPRYAG